MMYLKRVANTQYGMFGVLIYKDIPFALTLERPWLDNKKGKSCIPKGTYKCKRVQSSKFGNTFKVTDVPNRSHILFHKGNLKDDSHGCILIGEQFELLNGIPAVSASKKGYGEFMYVLKDKDSFNLLIEELLL